MRLKIKLEIGRQRGLQESPKLSVILHQVEDTKASTHWDKQLRRWMQLEIFDEKKNHLCYVQIEKVQIHLHLHVVLDEIICRTFSIMLNGSTRIQFNKLKPGPQTLLPNKAGCSSATSLEVRYTKSQSLTYLKLSKPNESPFLTMQHSSTKRNQRWMKQMRR